MTRLLFEHEMRKPTLNSPPRAAREYHLRRGILIYRRGVFLGVIRGLNEECFDRRFASFAIRFLV